jgi:hypothetical protein
VTTEDQGQTYRVPLTLAATSMINPASPNAHICCVRNLTHPETRIHRGNLVWGRLQYIGWLARCPACGPLQMPSTKSCS